MNATCKIWLQELDRGREHYKDFNDKNKYTGWRSGLVKTSEIEALDQLTFQVTIKIFEIYDKDGNNVTNEYIGLGIDSKQTITYLRKELQYEKAKVQRLTIEVDKLYHEMNSKSYSSNNHISNNHNDKKPTPIPQHSLSSHTHPHSHKVIYPPIPSHSHHVSVSVSESQLKARHNCMIRDICKIKFESWLIEIVGLEQYLINFKETECNDVRMIEFFDDECLENEIGIKTTLHRRLIMKKANEFKMSQDDFLNNKLNKNIEIKQLLEHYGILSMKDLKQDIKTKDDLCNILQSHDTEDENYKLLWKLVEKRNNNTVSGTKHKLSNPCMNTRSSKRRRNASDIWMKK